MLCVSVSEEEGRKKGEQAKQTQNIYHNPPPPTGSSKFFPQLGGIGIFLPSTLAHSLDCMQKERPPGQVSWSDSVGTTGAVVQVWEGTIIGEGGVVTSLFCHTLA